MPHLHLVPSALPQRPEPLILLPDSVDVALPGEDRCTDRLGRLRCVRRPHRHQPLAHVRVSGYYAEPEASAAPVVRDIDVPTSLVS